MPTPQLRARFLESYVRRVDGAGAASGNDSIVVVSQATGAVPHASAAHAFSPIPSAPPYSAEYSADTVAAQTVSYKAGPYATTAPSTAASGISPPPPHITPPPPSAPPL